MHTSGSGALCWKRIIFSITFTRQEQKKQKSTLFKRGGKGQPCFSHSHDYEDWANRAVNQPRRSVSQKVCRKWWINETVIKKHTQEQILRIRGWRRKEGVVFCVWPERKAWHRHRSNLPRSLKNQFSNKSFQLKFPFVTHNSVVSPSDEGLGIKEERLR